MDAFDYVDFAVAGPVRAEGPAVSVSDRFLSVFGRQSLQRWPGPADTTGHVRHVDDEQAMRVGRFAGDPGAFAPA